MVFRKSVLFVTAICVTLQSVAASMNGNVPNVAVKYVEGYEEVGTEIVDDRTEDEVEYDESYARTAEVASPPA